MTICGEREHMMVNFSFSFLTCMPLLPIWFLAVLPSARKIREGGKTSFALHAEISAEVVTKWRRKRRITVGLEQLNAQLPPWLFFLSLVLGSSERK